MKNKYSKALHHLVSAGKQGGLSAKQARKFAQAHLQEYLRSFKKQEKLFNALQTAAVNTTGSLPIGGKQTRSETHISTRAKQASNAAIIGTYGKRRSPVVYAGQTTDGPEVVTHTPSPERKKQRRRACAWAKGTIARLDAYSEKLADRQERELVKEQLRTWGITEQHRGCKLIAQ